MQTSAPRSTFITVLTWLLIIFSGFGTFIAVLQNLMLHLVFPSEQMNQAMLASEQHEQMPAIARFVFSHFHWFFGGFLVLFATLFAMSIGLLKRKNWARIFFIGFFAFGIAWNLATPFLQYHMMSSMFTEPMAGTGSPPDEFRIAMGAMLVFSALMAQGFSVLFAWLIKRLCANTSKAEFGTVDLADTRSAVNT